MILQLLREWPPGYGGVERVAHGLASAWGDLVYSFDAQGLEQQQQDALLVMYPRQRLAHTVPFGRLRLPLPSRGLWRLLRDRQPLHGHLPSPGVLLVLLLARLLRRRRRVTAHWHSFLDPDPGCQRWSPPHHCWPRSCCAAVVALSGCRCCPAASALRRRPWPWCFRHCRRGRR